MQNINGKMVREMTSTMSALSLVNSFHQADSQTGTLIFSPPTFSCAGDVVRGAVATSAPSADDPSLPTGRRQLLGLAGAKLMAGMRGTDGVVSSFQPFVSNFDSICTNDIP